MIMRFSIHGLHGIVAGHLLPGGAEHGREIGLVRLIHDVFREGLSVLLHDDTAGRGLGNGESTLCSEDSSGEKREEESEGGREFHAHNKRARRRNLAEG
jgi:hypothetical protein